jgi:hypothetical protein
VQATVFEGMDFRPLDQWIKTLEELQAEDPGFPGLEIESQVAVALTS